MALDFAKFFGVTNIGDTGLRENVYMNLMNFFDYAFLGVGAFVSVTHPSSGIFNNPFTRLRVSEDKNYTTGQAWETFRGNWVWESGINYPYQPIKISGVYVNGNYYPNGTSGTYSFNLNYPLGRVIFNTAIPTTSRVELDFSYRYINMYKADNPWFKQLMFNINRTDSSMFNQTGSGIWSIFGQNRAQLPAIFVELPANRSRKAKQLGGGQYIYQDVIFYIFTEDSTERNNLVDLIDDQKEHKIYLYDRTTLAQSGAMPLNIDGTLSSAPLTYPDLVNTYPWKELYFYEVTPQETTDYIPGMYKGIVHSTLEINY